MSQWGQKTVWNEKKSLERWYCYFYSTWAQSTKCWLVWGVHCFYLTDDCARGSCRTCYWTYIFLTPSPPPPQWSWNDWDVPNKRQMKGCVTRFTFLPHGESTMSTSSSLRWWCLSKRREGRNSWKWCLKTKMRKLVQRGGGIQIDRI